MANRDTKGRFVKGCVGFNKGKTFGFETRKKMSVAAKGRISWNKGLSKKTDSRVSGGRKSKGDYLHCGYMKRWINNKHVLVHHIVWIQENLISIPKGCCIHHINQNKLDNRIENLVLLPHNFHAKLHWCFERVLGITRNHGGD